MASAMDTDSIVDAGRSECDESVTKGHNEVDLEFPNKYLISAEDNSTNPLWTSPIQLNMALKNSVFSEALMDKPQINKDINRLNTMSIEDDSGPSLKELVTKNLEANGILGKIQAQLRASVFLTLEEELKQKDVPLINKNARELLSTEIGKLAVNLVQDFLYCLKLEFTLAVFNPEASNTMPNDILENRKSLLRKLGQSEELLKDVSYPVLFHLLEETKTLKILENNLTNSTPSPIQKNINNKNDEELTSGKPLSTPRGISHDKKINSSTEPESSLNLKSKDLEKDKSSINESQYDEEEFNSLSESKKDSNDDVLIKQSGENIKTVICLNSNKSEENIGTDDITEDEVEEDIDEDISEDQCDNSSKASNETKDNTASHAESVIDYQESL